VMPSYNCERTVAAAVLGLVNQLYRDWELIVVDDGSQTDIEPEIAQFDDSRIRLLRLAENGGVGRALNVALTESRGRYIARMDADDYMEEWRLGEQLRFLMLEGLSLCGTAAQKFGAETGTINSPIHGGSIVDSFFTGNPFVHPTMMFDRARLGGKLMYDDGFRCEEDYELFARLITPDNCANMAEVTVKYRVHPGGNANHPTKPVFNRLALERFASRMGVGDIAPVAELSELQMGGFVDEPAFRKLAAYAHQATCHNLPRLGFLQGPLTAFVDYARFIAWLDSHQASCMGASSDEPQLFAVGKPTAKAWRTRRGAQ